MKGDDAGTFKANDKYKDVPGAVLRPGNLPAMMGASVHSGEDVILTAMRPGSERVHGSMDNTEVFRASSPMRWGWLRGSSGSSPGNDDLEHDAA